MYHKKIAPQTKCGLGLIQELLSGKWKFMIIYYISQGSSRPSELLKKIYDIGRRVLNKQLNELLIHGFVTKQDHGDKIRKVEYNLSLLSESLLPVILSLEFWGEQNRDKLELAIIIDDKFSNVRMQ